MRIGHGYDVHRLVCDRKLILGGVHIEHELGLLGHSDADVVTHAVMDALLGAACLGDIGLIFPDTSEQFRDANSLALLGEVVLLLGKTGLKPHNIDCTILAQAPKLRPYIAKMQENISEVCGTKFVNIKATTEERLGFTGSKAGIAAHCVCTVCTITEV